MVRPLLLLLLGCMVLTVGCSDNSLEFTEVKRIDEKITTAELKKFLRIVSRLPDRTLPKMPRVLALPPEWNQTRTLPVNELVNEEKQRLDDHWAVEPLARYLQRSRTLHRALRRENMTHEQFVGMFLGLGAALSRKTLRDEQDLDQLLMKGESAIAALRSEKRSFNALSREGMHYMLQQAVWITRVSRAERLQLVPPENVKLVSKHWDKLAAVFPEEFLANPLDSIADLLEERGMPFEELPDSGSDEHIEWSMDDALVGTDPKDSSTNQQASLP